MTERELIVLISAGFIALAGLGLMGFYFLVRGPMTETNARLFMCAHEHCRSGRDPRCAGGNCSKHCSSALGCYGACIRVWEKNGGNAEHALHIARSAVERAKK